MKPHAHDLDARGRSVKVGFLRIEKLRVAENGILLGEIRRAGSLPTRPVGVNEWIVFVVYALLVYWLTSQFGSLYLLGLFLFAPLVAPGPFRTGRVALSQKNRNWLLHCVMSMGLDSRIWAIQGKDDITEVSDLADVAFEPVIINVEYKSMRLLFAWLGGVGLSAILVLGLRRFLVFDAIMATFGLSVPMQHLIMWLTSRWSSEYYRIWPGRMELLRFGPWMSNRQDAVVRAWDLRQSTVVSIGLMLYLASPTERSDVDMINVLNLSEPREFVHAVVRAAISSHETRSLPNDRLTV